MPGFIVTVTPAGVAEAEARLRQRLAAILDGSEPATPDSERNTRAALAKVERKVSRQTVETLDDARGVASLAVCDYEARHGVDGATLTAGSEAEHLPESGGSVSLPDGSTITVEPAGEAGER